MKYPNRGEFLARANPSGSSGDVSKIEEKFKLSLQNMEKRFVDLEVAISEVAEEVNSLVERVDSLSAAEEGREEVEGLRQRMDGIEDLIMVEQAGIIELKRIMEGVESRFETKPLEDKISEVEQVAQMAMERAGKITEAPTELTERIGLLEREIEDLKASPELERVSHLEIGELKKNLQAANRKIETMRRTVENLKMGMEQRLKTFAEPPILKLPELDMLNTKLGSLKASLDMLTNKKAEADLKISELEKKIELLKEEMSKTSDKRLFDELKKHKREIELSNVQIESLERVIGQLTDDIQKIEKTAERFKSIDRLINLKKEVDEKITSFKFVEDEIRKLSQRVEMIYEDLDKRIMAMKTAERAVNKMGEDFKTLTKNFETLRFELKKRVEKKDLADILKSMEKPAKIDKKIARTIEENAKRVQIELASKVDDKLNLMKHMANEITKRFDEISDMYKEVKSTPEDIKALKEEVKGVKSLVGKIADISEREEGVPKELKVVMDDLRARISGVESSLVDLDMTVNKISQSLESGTISPQDAYLKEIVDKLVFLESRLAAMETFFQKSQPIIME